MAVERKKDDEHIPAAPAIKLDDFVRRSIPGSTGDVLRVMEALRTGTPKLPELPGVPTAIGDTEADGPPIAKLTIVSPTPTEKSEDSH